MHVMPLIIDGGKVPPRWAEKRGPRNVLAIDHHKSRIERVQIALVNNMPDPALEDTEMQFFELIEAAAGDIPVHIQLYSLPGIPRGERGQQHLSSVYSGFDDLWKSPVDAVIVTGTEPRSADLRQEAYWPALAELLDWAERNTLSAILSCLAAHASVLHSDGIDRHKLEDKQFGVFTFNKNVDHALMGGTADLVRFPHSRWNEVREEALTACGYVVLTKSATAGVDSFVKKKRGSLFLHFQGHPEYSAQTLMKEYRRDIKRFLRRERETYPSMPQGYFDSLTTGLLSDFQGKALSDSREEAMAGFPETAVLNRLQNGWHSSARCVYQNWLQYVAARKAEKSAFIPPADLRQTQRKRSAVL
jgi:homoserine O-succinyltransferase/O-acetyltransferase